jgi:5-formyltetrahydrofolate cyclo-ligase
MTAESGGLDRQALRKEKAVFRARMRELRKTLAAEDRPRSAKRIEEALFGLLAIQNARTVLLFSSFGAEVPTQSIAERLLADGRSVLLPFLEGDMMHAGRLWPGDRLLSSSYGPSEPTSRTPVDPAEVDAVVAPGLAFDRHGYRIGYGAGHYDRYLQALRAGATRIGIAFHLQIVETVPHDMADEPMDIVVTEQETIICQRPAL